MPYNIIRSPSKYGQTVILTGTTGDDAFHGGYGTDIFVGRGGNDQFYGGYGNSYVDYRWAPVGIKVNLSIGGGTFQQTNVGLNMLRDINGIYGSNFADNIWGHNRNDFLSGGGGNDVINGSLGLDLIQGDDGNDILGGGDGDDTISGGNGDDVMRGENDKDLLDGGAGNDTIYGGNLADRLIGGYGDDILIGGFNGDVVDGGNGFDIASYSDSMKSILIDQRDPSGRSNTNDAGQDTYVNIEGYQLSFYNDKFIGSGHGWVTVWGMEGNDEITTGHGRDTIYGGAGDDILDGGVENDIIYGEAGNDLIVCGVGAADYLYGGAGNDIFRFLSGASESRYPDEIRDWNKGDKIDLSKMDPIPGGADNALIFTTGGTITAAGQVGMLKVDADTYRIFADSNGDRVADFFLLVDTKVPLTVSDFIL
jgi:Ca2+-binding RTX toxin-like protein